LNQKIILTSEEHRNRALTIIKALPLDPIPEILIREHKATRNLEQNARMWAMLTDIAEQVNWHGQHLTKEEWKDVFTAGLKRQKVVPGLDGGFVVIGAHTSKMTIAEMSELIEFAMAFGCQQQVRWKDPTLQEYP
jgi:hypothetical protein